MLQRFIKIREGRIEKIDKKLMDQCHVTYLCASCQKLTDSPIYEPHGILKKEWRCRNCGMAQTAAE